MNLKHILDELNPSIFLNGSIEFKLLTSFLHLWIDSMDIYFDGSDE
jgi:hypothetical protein